MRVQAVGAGCWLVDDTLVVRTGDDPAPPGAAQVVGPFRPGQQVALGPYTVTAHRDGRRYDVRSDAEDLQVSVAAGAEQPRTTLILGGARSGKSREAEGRLATAAEVVYVATSPREGHDREWRQRIDEHRRRRPSHWQTLETMDLVALLAEPGPPLLVDCLTLWLTGVMDEADAWDDGAWTAAEGIVRRRVDALAAAWQETRRRSVAVSNEVGSGVVPATTAGRRFRDLLGQLNTSVAAVSDEVLWCVAGRTLAL